MPIILETTTHHWTANHNPNPNISTKSDIYLKIPLTIHTKTDFVIDEKWSRDIACWNTKPGPNGV